MLSREQEDEFYVTLPSNASINFFENKTSSYLTKLCQPIHLTGNWVVGLSALTIPLSFYNIKNEEELIIQMRDKNTLQYNIKFPPGYYDSVQSILGSIPTIIQEQKKYRKSEEKPLDHLLEEMLKVVILNKNLEQKMQNDDVRIQNDGDIQIDNEMNNPIHIHYDESRNQVIIHHRRFPNRQYLFAISPGLQYMLGFSSNPEVNTRAVHFYPINPNKKPKHVNVTSPFPCNLDYNIPSEINVCLDIVKDQPLYGKLIRKVGIQQYQYGQIKSFVFDRPHYVKVEKKYFDTLQVDLKDGHGKNLPFQFGTSSITLHFKRK